MTATPLIRIDKNEMLRQWRIFGKGYGYPRYVWHKEEKEWMLVNTEEEFISYADSNYSKGVHTSIYPASAPGWKNFYLDTILFEIDGKDKLGQADIMASYIEMRDLVEYFEREYSYNPRVYFSGNRSFHVYADFYPLVVGRPIERLKSIANAIKTEIHLKDLDFNIFVEKHLIRLPYTLHEKSGLLSIGVDPSWNLFKIAKYSKEGPDEYPIKNIQVSQAMREAIIKVKFEPEARYSHNGSGVKYEWIEDLPRRPIGDGRHRVLWHILAPYLMNVRKLDLNQAYDIARAYFLECNKVRPLDPSEASFMREIKYYLKYSRNNNVMPWRPETVLKNDKELAELIGLSEVVGSQ